MFMTGEQFLEINRMKTFCPEVIEKEMKDRIRVSHPHTRLVLAAGDHNARMITAYGGNPIGLSDRREYLGRLAEILCAKGVDGLEATADVIEELVAFNFLLKRTQGLDFLKEKLLIGTANRGGLLGAAWELDDFCSAFTVERLADMNLDGVKFMLRIAPESAESRKTLSYCAEVVNQAEKYGLPVFVEGLFVRNEGGRPVIQKDLESLVKTAGVVSALGCTSLRRWLELPLCPQYERAAAASAASVLVVPDETGTAREEILDEYTRQAPIGKNVRGILLGRNVLYSRENPRLLAQEIADFWHGGISAEMARKKEGGEMFSSSG